MDARLFLFLHHQKNHTVMLKYQFPIIAVSDMEKSIGFYEEIVGDHVVDSFDGYVHFSGGFALEHVPEADMGGDEVSLRFEEDDLDAFAAYLKSIDEEAEIEEMPNGQRWIVVWDPDGHAIEVVENMDVAIKRMLASGMSVDAVSEKSQYPIEYVKRFVK